MKVQVFLLLVLSVLFGGCAFTHEVEIKDYSAKYVKRSDIGSVIGDDVNLPLVKDWTGDDFVVIEIYTGKDLLELATETGSSLFPDLRFCEQPEKKVLMGIHEIYAGGESITSSRLSDKVMEHDTQRDGNTLYKYDVVLFLVWDKKRELPVSDKKDKGQNYYLKYDLRKNLEDVCLSLRGSNLVQVLKSNQVKLTKLDIRKIIN